MKHPLHPSEISSAIAASRPRSRRIARWWPCAVLACCPLTRADTVAFWRFDEPLSAPADTVLRDSGPHGHNLRLGAGAIIVPGKIGSALRPVAARTADFTARSQPDAPRGPFANVTDSKLNLGPGDWTLDGWFRLDPEAREEGVIFEVSADPRGSVDLATRLSLQPRENAFVLTGLAPWRDAAGAAPSQRVEFPNPEGPPAGAARLFTVALVADHTLPRAAWFHAAIIHAAGTLHLLLDGRHSGAAALDLRPLPRSAEGTLALGRDGRGRRPFPGAIDELRVSDHAFVPTALPSRDQPARR